MEESTETVNDSDDEEEDDEWRIEDDFSLDSIAEDAAVDATTADEDELDYFSLPDDIDLTDLSDGDDEDSPEAEEDAAAPSDDVRNDEDSSEERENLVQADQTELNDVESGDDTTAHESDPTEPSLLASAVDVIAASEVAALDHAENSPADIKHISSSPSLNEVHDIADETEDVDEYDDDDGDPDSDENNAELTEEDDADVNQEEMVGHDDAELSDDDPDTQDISEEFNQDISDSDIEHDSADDDGDSDVSDDDVGHDHVTAWFDAESNELVSEDHYFKGHSGEQFLMRELDDDDDAVYYDDDDDDEPIEFKGFDEEDETIDFDESTDINGSSESDVDVEEREARQEDSADDVTEGNEAGHAVYSSPHDADATPDVALTRTPHMDDTQSHKTDPTVEEDIPISLPDENDFSVLDDLFKVDNDNVLPPPDDKDIADEVDATDVDDAVDVLASEFEGGVNHSRQRKTSLDSESEIDEKENDAKVDESEVVVMGTEYQSDIRNTPTEQSSSTDDLEAQAVFEDDSEVHATISEDLEVQATFSEDYKKQTTFTESSEAPQDSPDDASRAHRAAADDSEAQTASTDISHPRISAVDDPAVTEDIGEFNKQLFGAEADDEDSFFDALGSLLGLEPAADEPPEDAERGDSITTPSALPFDELFSAS